MSDNYIKSRIQKAHLLNLIESVLQYGNCVLNIDDSLTLSEKTLITNIIVSIEIEKKQFNIREEQPRSFLPKLRSHP